MSTVEIRTDLPMPPDHARSRIDYPFGELKIGHCIVVKWGSRGNVSAKARAFVKANPGWQIHMRTIKNGETAGFWCTARPDAPSTSPVTSIRRIEPAAHMSKTSDAATATTEKLRAAAKLTKTGTRTVVRK